MRIVITGGAGFIGGNLCCVLAQAGHQVVALDDLSTGQVGNLQGLDVELVEGSIVDRQLVRSVLDGADAVVHLAARGSVPRSLADPLATHEANATGTAEMLEAARLGGVGHIVVASSSSVYGANPALPKHEELAVAPLSPYGASKLLTESLALAYQHSFGMAVMTFRFFNVFGPLQPADHDYAAVIPRFIDAALADRPVEVHGDGQQSRDFTYVGTLVNVLAESLAHRTISPGPVNLAFGSQISLIEVLASLEELLGHPIARCHVAGRTGDVRHSSSDATRLLELFPDLKPVRFEDGLAKTLTWFRQSRPPTR
ncbi:MAG: NAD-dependent epimerase/dehydratase family protein [Acidimicrobiales bacterium]